jgi:pimeloyl-ACP methyl ester carboxylesterase
VKAGFLERPGCRLYSEATGSGPAIAKYAKRGRAITVPQAGHSVYFERAARFNQDIEEFLKESA